jgi:hypothetical protein
MKGIQSVFLISFLNDGLASFLHGYPFDINEVLQLATPAMPPPEWKWEQQKWIRIALQDFSLALRRRALEGAASNVNLETVEGQAAFARDVMLSPMRVWLPPKHSFEWIGFNVDMYPLLRTSPLHAARVAAVYDQRIHASTSFMHSFLTQETTYATQRSRPRLLHSLLTQLLTSVSGTHVCNETTHVQRQHWRPCSHRRRRLERQRLRRKCYIFFGGEPRLTCLSFAAFQC